MSFMPWKKRLLSNAKLYLILDTQVNSYERLLEIAREAVESGVDVLQLRDKNGSAKDILEFSRRVKRFLKERVLYLINDRVDLALAAAAGGAHLGQDDVPVRFARKIMGKKAIIGVSCQNLSHLKRAQEQGADYIGFGSVFKTLTKPQRDPMDLDVLTKALRIAQVPVFAIGGITTENAVSLYAHGVRRIAVCRAVCMAKDVKKSIRELKLKIEKESRGNS